MAEIPERVKTRSQLVEEAISAALERDWKNALELNQEIVSRFGVDEETHNRLGKVYTELGKMDDALSAYKATLELNPLNTIALKNVNRLETLMEEKTDLPKGGSAVDVGLFVEETGKTAVANVVLDKGAGAGVVSAGDQVKLVPAGDALNVETSTGTRLGHVEAKLARRVLKFIEGGNEYTAAVATSDGKALRIIIRETKQAAQFAGVPSFPVRKGQEFRAHARDSLLRDADSEAGLEDGDDEDAGAEGDEDLEGMHPVEPGMEDAADLADEDSRAEDNY
ncbi:MAG TPA: tetratricopeptide repeat protein [Candidatus Dormibacteraeota bacterium]|nr:tetratricopeptide repeat protein [Candidatus Dormibacteraeota bacterium]